MYAIRSYYEFGELDSALIYKTVFDKHGYTRADMSRSIAYYSTETKKIVPIYDEVHARLSAQSEEMQELIQKITLSATYRVWRSEENRYRIKGDTVSYLEPFDFNVITSYSIHYTKLYEDKKLTGFILIEMNWSILLVDLKTYGSFIKISL